MNPSTVHRLLGPDTARPLLAAILPSAASSALEVESVWAKPGRHLNVCWLVGEGAEAERVSLCVVREDEGAKALRRAAKRLSRGGACLADRDVLAQRFPFDYRLPCLADCVTPEPARRVLGDDAVDACEVVAYRAGMRCQVRFDSRGIARAYGKTAFEREPGRRAELHRWVADATTSTTMRLPSPLGGDEATGLEFVEAAPGRSLHDHLADGPDRPRLVEAVAALEELHRRVPAPPWREHRAKDELALLATWTAWMENVEPSMGPPLRRVLAQLEAAAPDAAGARFAHRDFHDKQVLMAEGGLWLLDVDTACTGDPELDLGNLVAHLFLRGLQWGRAGAHADLELAAEAAYGPGAREAATRWYRRASLARLACVYRLRPRWAGLAGALLEEALRP